MDSFDDIHLGRVELASPAEFTEPLIEAARKVTPSPLFFVGIRRMRGSLGRYIRRACSTVRYARVRRSIENLLTYELVKQMAV